MDLLDRFFAQVNALQQVWMPFLLAVFIVGVVIWRILKHHYSGQIDSKDALITLRDAQLQDYKDKLSGATPEEAKARLEALEAQVRALSPRRINAEMRRVMVPILSPFGGLTIEIALDAAGDTKPLAEDFGRIFEQAGWNVIMPTVLGIGRGPASGIELGVENPDALTPAQSAIVAALGAAAISFDLTNRRPTARGREASLLVTRHHEPVD